MASSSNKRKAGPASNEPIDPTSSATAFSPLSTPTRTSHKRSKLVAHRSALEPPREAKKQIGLKQARQSRDIPDLREAEYTDKLKPEKTKRRYILASPSLYPAPEPTGLVLDGHGLGCLGLSFGEVKDFERVVADIIGAKKACILTKEMKNAARVVGKSRPVFPAFSTTPIRDHAKPAVTMESTDEAEYSVIEDLPMTDIEEPLLFPPPIPTEGLPETEDREQLEDIEEAVNAGVEARGMHEEDQNMVTEAQDQREPTRTGFEQLLSDIRVALGYWPAF